MRFAGFVDHVVAWADCDLLHDRKGRLVARIDVLPPLVLIRRCHLPPRPAGLGGRLSHVRALAVGKFFKYLAQEYALDALAEHDAVPDDPAREVTNPAHKALDEPIRAARTDVPGT